MNSCNESVLGKIYTLVYNFICGINPYQNILHFQWLSARSLNKAIPRIISDLDGDILDVGCGDKPYKKFFKGEGKYVGLDVYDGANVDLKVKPLERWPLPDCSFDSILCTQVLEHSSDFSHVCGEISRVLKKGGKVVISVPFIYGEHGAPNDFWRFSFYGMKMLFPSFIEEYSERQGGIWSSMAILFLNWFNTTLNHNFFLRILKGVLLPLNLLLSLCINVFVILMDMTDFTKSFYGNGIIVMRKE